MSDYDSDFDDVAHEKLLKSIKTPGSVKKATLKQKSKGKIDASSLLSHITISRTSTNKAKESLGIKGIEEEKTVEADEKKSSKKRKGEKSNEVEETKRKKKVIKSKTLVPMKDLEARKKLEGEIAFRDLKKEVSGSWNALVQSNRIADQLIFPLTQPEGLLWGNEEKEEKLTAKEIEIKKATDVKMAKERLGQMQRMRAVMAIQEAKNRYMKKIKSKGYHRILKREERKQLLKEFDDLVTRDPDAAHEKLAELDLQRVMERGSLKHRGQNQKFKQMLEKHASRNPEVKKLLDEHLRLGRELKQKVSQDDDDEDETSTKTTKNEEKKQSVHDVLKDAAIEAAKESNQIGKALAESFINDTAAQKLTLAQMRADKRREAASHARNISAKDVSEPLFNVEDTWEATNSKDKTKSKKGKKEKKGSIAKKSYVDNNYDPHKQLSYEEKVELAVEASGVNDEEKRQHEIAIDPRKFLELTTNDLTHVSSDFVEKMNEFEEDSAQVINEAFKDDDVVGDFEHIKESAKEREKVKDVDLTLAGWGAWAGPGMTEKQRRKNFVVKAKEKKRKDGDKNGVIIKDNISAAEGIGKIQPRSLPFPFTRVQDYEAVLKQPLGLEWNMEHMRDELCKPAVVVESGRAIRPINKKQMLGE